MPSEVAYVGDTGVDMLTAKNAGVLKSIGVCWGYRSVDELNETGADVIVDRPADIVSEVLRNA